MLSWRSGPSPFTWRYYPRGQRLQYAARCGDARGGWDEALTLLLVIAGVAIFGYIGALIVEAIARGVVTGAIAELRRRRTIEQLRDHYIICAVSATGGPDLRFEENPRRRPRRGRRAARSRTSPNQALAR